MVFAQQKVPPAAEYCSGAARSQCASSHPSVPTKHHLCRAPPWEAADAVAGSLYWEVWFKNFFGGGILSFTACTSKSQEDCLNTLNWAFLPDGLKNPKTRITWLTAYSFVSASDAPLLLNPPWRPFLQPSFDVLSDSGFLQYFSLWAKSQTVFLQKLKAINIKSQPCSQSSSQSCPLPGQPHLSVISDTLRPRVKLGPE